MFAMKYKHIFFSISGVLVIASLVLLAMFGLRVGIEFAGGTLVEVKYSEALPEKNVIETTLEENIPGLEASIQQVGDDGYIVRSRFLTDEEQTKVVSSLQGIAEGT